MKAEIIAAVSGTAITSSTGRRRGISALVWSLLLSIGLVPAARADVVTIYNWESYIAEEVLAQFTAETGHSVREVYYNDEGVRDSVITSGRALGYDLIMMEHVGLRIMAAQGLFQNLAEINARHASDTDPRWASACGDSGVPYAWGTVGILYRESLSQTPITRWRQLFEPPTGHSGRVVMVMDQVDTVGTALLALGVAPDTEDRDKLKQAYALLQSQQPHLLAQTYGLSYALQEGEASRMSLALGYAGDLDALKEATGQTDWVYQVPDEGTILWVDCFTAPGGRPLSTAARKFLHFISRPEIAAHNAELLYIATTSQAALDLTSEAYREDSSLFPPPELMDKSRRIKPMSVESLRLRDRIVHQFYQAGL